MPQPTAPVRDTFTGTAGTLLTTYDSTNWGTWAGLSSSRIAASGTALADSGSAGSGCYYKTSYAADQEVYATIIALPPTSALSFLLACRIQNPTNLGTINYYDLRWTYNSATPDVFTINKTVAGTTTALATDSTGSFDLAANDKLWLNAVGTTITLYRYNSGTTNWQQVLQVTDSAVTGAGFTGHYIVGTSTAGTWDDYGAGPTSTVVTKTLTATQAETATVTNQINKVLVA